ncbi:hypothetical protein BV25DRAFT_1895794, partial [Artomyces pyxidatus]
MRGRNVFCTISAEILGAESADRTVYDARARAPIFPWPRTMEVDNSAEDLRDVLNKRIPIPPEFNSKLLPDNALKSSQLRCFPLPPLLDIPPALLKQPTLFVKQRSYFSAENVWLLLGRPIPSREDVDTMLELGRILPALDAGNVSICYPIKTMTEANLKMPIWVLTYWYKVHRIMEAKSEWAAALTWVEQRLHQGPEFSRAKELLEDWPWNINLPSDMGVDPLMLLRYFSHRWLAAEQMNQMAVVLDDSLRQAHRRATIATVDFSNKLLKLYRARSDGAYLTKRGITHIHGLGDALNAGDIREVGMSIGVRVGREGSIMPATVDKTNHWIAVVITVDPLVVRYGDPLQPSAPPAELFDMLQWWLGQHLPGTLTQGDALPSTPQDDTFSCSVFSQNAMAHHFFPAEQQLLHAKDYDRARVDQVLLVMNYLRSVCGDALQSVTLPAGFLIGADTFATVPTAYLKAPVEKRPHPEPDSVSSKGAEKGSKRPKLLGTATKMEEVAVSAASRVKSAVQPKASVGAAAGSSKNRGTKEEWSFMVKRPESAAGVTVDAHRQNPAAVSCDNADTDPEPKPEAIAHGAAPNADAADEGDLAEGADDPEFDPLEFIDIKPPKKIASVGGRPTVPDMDVLTRRCYQRRAPEKQLWRCVGGTERCKYALATRTTDRVLRHAKDCPKLPSELRDFARSKSASESLSQKVAGDASKMVLPANTEKGKRETQLTKTSAKDAVTDLHTASKQAGRTMKQNKLDLAIVKLVCAAGLPTYIVSRPEWTDLWREAVPFYQPATRDRLEYDHIAKEAAWVQRTQLDYLRTQEDLTVSYDGGTTTGRESYWTLHVSTPGDRKVFLMETREATAESHTAVWIIGFIRPTIESIGPSRVGAVCSDSTGNTRLSRAISCTTLTRNALNLADCCHHLNRMLLDISKLVEFQPAIRVMRKTITLFHTSHSAHTALKEARDRHTIGRGLEAVGKTRFATIILSAVSVQRNASAIKDVIAKVPDSGIYKDIEDYYQPPPDRDTFEFESSLSQLILAGMPATKALACLEALEATAADVYIFWHAVLQATNDTLSNKKLHFKPDLANAIRGILNDRHDQLFETGNLASDVYLAAAYLNHNYLQSDIWLDEPPDDADLAGIRHPRIFKRTAVFLMSVAEGEILHGHKEVFTCWKSRATAFKEQLRAELLAYARQQYPFNIPVDETIVQGVRKWWMGLIGNRAQILPHLAIKIYSVRVNSMPDEVTGSAFTWLTPKLRNRLSVGAMSGMTQVRQFHQTDKKARAGANARPTVKFYEIKKNVFPDISDDDDDVDEVLDGWPDEPSEDDTAARPLAPYLTDIPLVNLNSKLISALLAEEAPQEIQEEKGKDLASFKGPVDDNDFSSASFFD